MNEQIANQPARQPVYRWIQSILLSCALIPCIGLAADIQYTSHTNLFLDPAAAGRNPQSRLVLGTDGASLFGTCRYGGSSGFGTIFTVKTDGSQFQTLHHFEGGATDGILADAPLPRIQRAGNWGGLILGTDKYLYGVTPTGGSKNRGIAYRLSQGGSDYRIIHHFEFEAPFASLTQGRDGLLYGTGVQGALFRMNPDGSNYAVITNLQNINSYSSLFQAADGALYGTHFVNEGEQLFAINTDGSGFRVVHSFASSDGSLPFGTPCQTPDGHLVGTLFGGGAGDSGSIFRVNPDGTDFQVVHAFAANSPSDGSRPTSGLVLGNDGWLYGTTSGNNVGENGIYRIKPDGSGYHLIRLFADAETDGFAAFGGVTLGSFEGDTGALFGTTASGGASGNGTVYSVILNPPLSIAPGTVTLTGGQTRLFWPSWAVSYRLQSRTNLATGSWAEVTNATPILGATVPVQGDGTFFRLVAP